MLSNLLLTLRLFLSSCYFFFFLPRNVLLEGGFNSVLVGVSELYGGRLQISAALADPRMQLQTPQSVVLFGVRGGKRGRGGGGTGEKRGK